MLAKVTDHRDRANLAVAIGHDLARTTVPSAKDEVAFLATVWQSYRDRRLRNSTANGTSSWVRVSSTAMPLPLRLGGNDGDEHATGRRAA